MSNETNTPKAGTLPPSSLPNLIQQMTQALEIHRDWLLEWHRCALCRLPMNPEHISADSHRLCRLGQWISRPEVHVAMPLDRRERIESLHEKMHAQARTIAMGISQGFYVKVSDYDLLSQLAREFALELLGLERWLRARRLEIDPLTGVRNRHGMLERLEIERQRSVRIGQPAALAMIDVDGFKLVNDQLGHEAGDAILQVIAKELSSRLRPYDFAHRFGGDEFLVCLPHTSIEAALVILGRANAATSLASLTLNPEAGISLSIGVTDLGSAPSVHDAIEQADSAMYQAKRGGRGRVEVYCEEYSSKQGAHIV